MKYLSRNFLIINILINVKSFLSWYLRNFLSYSYILYKFFELLELDEHLPYLNLLKSRDKLHQQDIIWEKICIDLKWEYIPSV